MITTYKLEAALERRGFHIIAWIPEPEQDRLRMVVRLGNFSMPKAFSFTALETIRMSIGDLIAYEFREVTHYQKFLACMLCGAPLLYGADQEMVLKLYRKLAKPGLTLQVKSGNADEVISRLKAGLPIPKGVATFLPDTSMDEAIAQATGCRSAKAGPDSPILTHCSTCGVVLADNVREIED